MGKTHRPPGKDLQPLPAAFAKNPVAALLKGIQDLASTVPAPTRGAPPRSKQRKFALCIALSALLIYGNAVSRDDRTTARWRQNKLTSKAL